MTQAGVLTQWPTQWRVPDVAQRLRKRSSLDAQCVTNQLLASGDGKLACVDAFHIERIVKQAFQSAGAIFNGSGGFAGCGRKVVAIQKTTGHSNNAM